MPLWHKRTPHFIHTYSLAPPCPPPPPPCLQVTGYAFGEAGKPGLVVLQEWWGIDGDIKHNGAKFASKGFRVVVPDLYEGKLGLEAEEAHHLMTNLNWPQAVQDVGSAAQFLQAEGSKKVGVTGFCMGGALSLAAAVLVPEIAAAVPFYGIPDPALADPAKMTKPVQGHFGLNDGMKGFSDPEAAKALEEKLKAAGVEHEVHLYEGVGHAFMNETPEGVERRSKLGQGEHHQGAIDTAFERAVTFLHKHLE